METDSTITLAIERATDTKALDTDYGSIDRTGQMFSRLFPGKKATVIADCNTWNAAGRKVMAVLEEDGIEVYEPLIITDPELYAGWSYLEQVQAYLENTDAIAIAVGSGTINDLVKLASHRIGRRYMIVGTAASMDGYTAFGASITKDGNKQTFSCRAPLGVIADPVICAAAPEGMSASGYADLIAKIPAGADWILAEAIGAEKIDRFAFSLVQGPLRDSLSDPEGLSDRKIEPTEQLAKGLIMSGFAMQAIQSSRPASGLEHQFSHYWDMEGLCFNGRHVSHGFKVGIGTLVNTACYEFILAYDMDNIDIDECTEKWPGPEEMRAEIERVFEGKPGHLARGLEESTGKYVSKERIRQELTLVKSIWPDLKKMLAEQIFSYEHILECLKKAGAPYSPEMIGLSNADMRTAFRALPYMRSRYTIIDLIYRCRLMDKVEDALFGKGGKWEV